MPKPIHVMIRRHRNDEVPPTAMFTTYTPDADDYAREMSDREFEVIRYDVSDIFMTKLWCVQHPDA